MPKPILLVLLSLLTFGGTLSSGRAEAFVSSRTSFRYQSSNGQLRTVRVIHRYYGVIHPDAPVDSRIDPHLRRAASIAQERANARTKARCWRYVKEALVAAGAVNSYPQTNYACQAGDELVHDFGFHRLSMRDPYAAPVGSVIVYGRGSGGAGHVELRTKNGFVSDYYSKNRCYYPVLAVYAKYSS
ncbi:MAG: hypothetical protein M3032_11700 [Verrucomicrobiota bacterium]|nr:hypothetical protein [Verrucomicrobiota bacterium]